MALIHDNRASLKRKIRSIAVVAGLLAVAGLLGAAFTRFGSRDSSVSPVEGGSERQEDAKGRDEVVLACPGRVEGLSEVIDVGAGIDGVLSEVRVREGQRVAAGEVIALIACGDLAAELQAARAATEIARQARHRLLRGSREEERRVAADEAAAAEAVLKQTQLQHQRMARLFATGDVSKESLEKAHRDLEVAKATLRAAADRCELVNAPPLPEEIAKADAEVRAAEERVKTVAAKLEKCTVKATVAGRVLRCYLKAGETVSAIFPRPIVSLADTSHFRVRAEVDERDIGRIHPGQPVVVLADAFPNKRFAARVSHIGALMGLKKVRTGDPAEKSDRDVLEVLVDLAETDERLVVGLRTTVQFMAGGRRAAAGQ